jgi:hypothetical protein
MDRKTVEGDRPKFPHRQNAFFSYSRNALIIRDEREVKQPLYSLSDNLSNVLLEFYPPRLDQADEVGVRFDAFDVSFGYSWDGKFFD